MIEFPCPTCGAKLKVSDDGAGRVGKCRHCEAKTIIPAKQVEVRALGWWKTHPNVASVIRVIIAVPTAIFALIGIGLLLFGFSDSGESAKLKRQYQEARKALEEGDRQRAKQLDAMNRIEEILGKGRRMTQAEADEAYRHIRMMIDAYPDIRESMEALYVNFPPERLMRAEQRYALTGGR